MLIKDWQLSFANCDLVNPPLVHDLEQNVASYFNPLFNRTNRMWLFLSLYGSLDYTNRKPLSSIQAKGGLPRGMWVVAPVPVKSCQFKLCPLSHVTWKWPHGFLPSLMSDYFLLLIVVFFCLFVLLLFTSSPFTFLFDRLSCFLFILRRSTSLHLLHSVCCCTVPQCQLEWCCL